MQSPDSNTRKRRHHEATSRAPEGKPAAKRRKTFASGYSPEFWNTLSVVKLTRRALKEFDQRIARSSLENPILRKKNHENPNRRILRSTTRRIRKAANEGGPDLSRLRGYATMPQSNRNSAQLSENSRKRSIRSASTSKQASKTKTKTTSTSKQADKTKTTSTSKQADETKTTSTSKQADETKTTSTSKQADKTKTTSPYSAEFEQKMIDLGIYPKSYRYPDGSRPPKPSNLEEIQEVLRRSRASLSPTIFPQSVFEDFQDQNELATSESKAMSRVFPVIAGSKDKQYISAEDVPFKRLKKFEDDLTTPKPDVYYGAQPSQINQQVRRDLKASIVPLSRWNSPAAPNFFVEGKSADGRLDIARRQAMYDGAVGARGIHQLQNYKSETVEYDGNAYTLSSIYQSGPGILEMYATYPMESESSPGETEYYMTQLNGYYMTVDHETFIKGVSAFRNGREWAREQRDIHIANANSIAQAMSPNTTGNNSKEKMQSTLIDDDSGESETSLDELSLPDPPKRRRANTSSRASDSRRASSSRSTAS